MVRIGNDQNPSPCPSPRFGGEREIKWKAIITLVLNQIYLLEIFMRHLIKTVNQPRGHVAAHSTPTPPGPDPLAALQAQVAAQQVQINTLQTQTSALQTQNTAQQTQLDAQAWLLNQLNVPKLNHDNEGAWSVGYIGTLPALWQVWTRSDLNTDWSNTAAYAPANFPVNDIGLMPPGAQWWQIYVCGSDSSNNPLTPFSNVVSLGPVP